MISHLPSQDIRPGMFAVVDTGAPDTGALIRFGEYLVSLTEGAPGDKVEHSRWDHAVICSRITYAKSDQTGALVPVVWIVEAEPGGAVERPWHYEDRPHLWSAGIIETPESAGLYARKYIGTGYSFLDYEAIACHSLHIPAPGLKSYIATTRHLICSQLVDQSELDAGCHLFDDGRWPGFVTPYHLGLLLGS